MKTPDPGNPNDELILSSWSRCAEYGLSPDNPPQLDLLNRGCLSDRVEANARLLTFAQPIIEHLHVQLDHHSSMVLLADHDGLILRAIGEGEFVAKAHRVALMPGASWSEQQMGTNAIGTAIREARTVAVFDQQHFLERNRFLTCIATPIHAPTGGMLGILDLSSDVRASLPHARALLNSTAEMIEHRLLDSMQEGFLTLHFSLRPEILGSALEAIALFEECGTMLACNRNARALLGLTPHAALPHFDNCFRDQWRQVGRLVSRGGDGPTRLQLHDGRHLATRVRMRMRKRVARTTGRSATAAPPPNRCAFDELDHGDPRMQLAVDRAQRIAERNIPLLIQGETGSGKEWFARAFHHCGSRRHGPWVPVNCASIPATLIESELFGYAPGAFTGARARGARGKIQDADGGTLFLDEIGDMPPALQAVLLRVLETRCVVPLGGSEEIPVDIGLVCASHRPLQQMVSEGSFRADLLYRLNGLTVVLPPLRQRADFDDLVAHMVRDECPGRRVWVEAHTLALLRRQPWPGNLRQLRNVLRVAIAMLGPNEHQVTVEHLPEECIEQAGSRGSAESCIGDGGDLRAAELRMVRDCLARHSGNVSAAARELGITRTTLYRKLRAAERATAHN